ncbi:hypothetical protein Trydic_g8995 [Trypoxylus dichotomus]
MQLLVLVFEATRRARRWNDSLSLSDATELAFELSGSYTMCRCKSVTFVVIQTDFGNGHIHTDNRTTPTSILSQALNQIFNVYVVTHPHAPVRQMPNHARSRWTGSTKSVSISIVSTATTCTISPEIVHIRSSTLSSSQCTEDVAPSSPPNTEFLKMHHKVTILVAPALHNSSCTHPRYSNLSFFAGLSPGDVLQALVVFSLTFGVLAANSVLILVINSRRYSKYIHSQPRYLLTSLASNDLAMGFFVTPFAIVPSLRNCWPYGELVCQIQALLRGAISQQSAVILICMAMDRYLCMLHPARYHKHSSKKGCVAVISMTWILSVTVFAVLVLPRGGYYFNSTGMIACEPFYSQASIRILAACGFYFPTTMILMYCYGSAFHVNKLRLKRAGYHSAGAATGGVGGVGGASMTLPNDYITSTISANSSSVEKMQAAKLVSQERRLSTSASRTMAAMSLGFIVLVTPWTIQEVVAACTGTRAPPPLDFLATWLALSNSFWNPFLYWLLNNHFRRISRELLFSKFFCKKKEARPQHCCSNSSSGQIHHQQGCDFEGLSEKYWGEILERTLSSNSLQALQRSCHHPAKMDKCNGIQEMKVFDTAVPDL